MEDFGKPIYFSPNRINDDTVDILKYLREFSGIMKKEPFTAMEFMQFIHEENPVQVNITAQKIRSLFNNMYAKGDIKKTVKNATARKHQKYVLKSNQFAIESKKLKRKSPQPKSKPKFKTDKTKSDPQFEFEKKGLTLEDAKNMKEMDVAFIGYSIVKEIEASLGMISVLEEEIKHLKDSATSEEVYKVKLTDMQDKHGREVNILKEKIKQLSQDIQKLNNQIVTKNAIIERLENTQGNTKTTFKMGELARLKNDKRPSHLR